MVVLAENRVSHRTLRSPGGALCLEIVGTQRQGQRVRLAAAKCTIGSANGCTLRLRAAGVRPVHCLILRGAHGTVARCWSPDTRLNGRGFHDELLTPGDTLSLGPIQLAVVELGEPLAAPRQLEPLDDETGPVAKTTAASRARKLLSLARDWRQQTRELGDRIEQLLAERESLHADRQRLGTALTELEVARQQAAPHPVETASNAQQEQALREEHERIETQRQALLAERHEWEARQTRLEQELLARQQQHRQAEQELARGQAAFQQAQARQSAELADAQAAIEAERNAWLQESELERQRLHDRETQHRNAAVELESRLALFAQEQQAWSAAQANDETLLEARLAELDRRQAELTAAAGRLDDERQQVAQQHQADRAALAERAAELEQQRAELERRHGLLTGREVELAAALAAYAQREQAWETPQAALPASQPNTGDIPRAEVTDATALEAIERRAQALCEAEADLRDREADFLARCAEANAQIDQGRQQLEARRCEFEDQERQAREELLCVRREFESQIAATRAQLVAEQAQWEQRAAQPLDQPVVAQLVEAAPSAELLEREQQLRELQAQLEQRQAELERDRAQLAAGQADLQQSQATLDSQWDEARQELAEQRAQLAEDRRALMNDVELERANAAADREQLEQARRELDAAREERPEPTSRRPSSGGLATAAYLPSSEGDDQPTEPVHSGCAQRFEPEPEEEAEPEPPRARRPARGAEQTSEEDQSIEEYMAALLKRRGTGRAVEPAERPSRKTRPRKPQPVEPKAAEAVDEVAKTAPAPEPAVPAAPRPTELPRRNLAAQTVDLAPMRELCNTHAHIAITAYGKKRLLRRAIISAALSVGCIKAALVMWAVAREGSPMSTGALVPVVGSIYWGLLALNATQKWLITRKLQQAGRTAPQAPNHA